MQRGILMSEYVAPAVLLRRAFDAVLSEGVRPFLRSRGFAKSGRTFRRTRGPVHDMINFQGNKWNSVTPHHGFFVNVGVGSSEIDAAYNAQRKDGTSPTSAGYILETRWESLVPDAPKEVTFDETTDMINFADMLCTNLDRVLAVIDPIDTTAALAQWAISNKSLHRMARTCSYLAVIGDTESLTHYVSIARERFGDSPRWPVVGREICDATGAAGRSLQDQGLLDQPVRPKAAPLVDRENRADTGG